MTLAKIYTHNDNCHEYQIERKIQIKLLNCYPETFNVFNPDNSYFLNMLKNSLILPPFFS